MQASSELIELVKLLPAPNQMLDFIIKDILHCGTVALSHALFCSRDNFASVFCIYIFPLEKGIHSL